MQYLPYKRENTSYRLSTKEKPAIEFQTEKTLVRHFYTELDKEGADLHGVLQSHTDENFLWHGYHPFDELNADQLVERFWLPLRGAIKHMQRREDVFFAGLNEIDGYKSTWVVSMGHLMGLFDEPWLNIQPTGKMVFLRYCEFHQVEHGKIQQSSMYFDIPHLMIQAGLHPFPQATAMHMVQPGPMTHDGLLYDEQDPSVGKDTLSLINKMINELGQWQSELSLEDELRQSWAEDMIWWGPAGIGATYTIERYAQQHSAPFRAGLDDRSKTNHVARLAEGNYGGFFGRPNFTARSVGGFMGMPATDRSGEFRVIDIYRRRGNQLVENWIFIDILHFWKTSGAQLDPSIEQAIQI